jgi:hypothetical protein
MQTLKNDLVITKHFRISPDIESKKLGIFKSCKVELTIPSGTTTVDMANALCASEVIKTQNSNRNNYDKLVDGTTFKRTFNKPASQIDPMDQMIMDARSSGIDPTDTDAMTMFIMEKLAKHNQ